MNTSNSGSNGHAIGTRINGAIEVVHGIGESIRGTVLGAIDKIAHDETENNEITRRGRVEIAEGMAKMKGHGAATSGTGGYGGAATGTGYSDSHAAGVDGHTGTAGHTQPTDDKILSDKHGTGAVVGASGENTPGHGQEYEHPPVESLPRDSPRAQAGVGSESHDGTDSTGHGNNYDTDLGGAAPAGGISHRDDTISADQHMTPSGQGVEPPAGSVGYPARQGTTQYDEATTGATHGSNAGGGVAGGNGGIHPGDVAQHDAGAVEA